ncbi:DsrE family protein [Aureitalea marina]|uniref:Uncharacterized protein n=1 Tax=Aureitalea marina TaxID=930804 RepID=A0A2S7KQF9_9FLAO|nr:DsrE family protein [Aureitalea marina]PQB04855.1 hypothetical protein BST85_08105 [Aureitalea marina]
MRKFVSVLMLLIGGLVMAQEKPVKIVFDVTSADEGTHQSTIRHVKFMSEAYPESEFEVVMYSKAMNMVLADKSSVAKDIETLAAEGNVSFKICQGTMNRYKVSEDQLIKGVDVVPDGILEIIQKQAEGWGYIKEAHQ